MRTLEIHVVLEGDRHAGEYADGLASGDGLVDGIGLFVGKLGCELEEGVHFRIKLVDEVEGGACELACAEVAITQALVNLADAELSTMTVDLNNIIETLRPITEYELEGVEPTFHPIGSLSNVMREDEIGESFARDVALSNSDSTSKGCFEIPSILGEGGDR